MRDPATVFLQESFLSFCKSDLRGTFCGWGADVLFENKLSHLGYLLVGTLDQQEFADGLSAMRIPWKELTGCQDVPELFSHFDDDNSGEVNL